MKKIIVFLLLITLCSFSNYSSAREQLPAGTKLMVDYYGRPGVASPGILGQFTIEELMPKIKEQAAEYAKIIGDENVTPAFHLIYGLAAADPGRDKDYLIPLSDEKIMKYTKAAKDNSFAVIIDSQLGKMTPIEAIKPVLKYLQYDNVHLAIDPEFEVYGLDVRPGKVIGHITGEEINQVQSAMMDYMKENGVEEDKPSMMTPKQVLGIELVGGAQIKEAPKYINYQ